MNKKLEIIPTIVDGVQIGLKNFPSLVIASILYVLTLWVPYINVGTTIAMQTVPGRLAKGEVISPVFIFDSTYREDFSAYFLLCGFMYISILMGLFFGFIPGIVISISLQLSTMILIDDKTTPLEAMRLSNVATKGNKWTIFFTMLLFFIVFYIGFVIITAITSIFDSGLFTLIVILLCSAMFFPFSLGINSVIYRELYLNNKENICK
jgi:uncharacterized membrane protein